MTAAETFNARGNGHGSPFPRIPWPSSEKLENFARQPRINLPIGKPNARLFADRVRAKPAVSPQLSFMLGQGALGLGFWGTLFPNSVKRTLGIRASTPTVQALFGARELATGVALTSDPTKAGVLWARVAGDVFDIAILSALDRPENPKRGAARAALGFVLAVSALDLITAVRMSTVKRTCD